jgi:hypothetical protein
MFEITKDLAGQRQLFSKFHWDDSTFPAPSLDAMEPVELAQDEKFREWGWKTFLAFEKPRPVWKNLTCEVHPFHGVNLPFG